MELRTVGLPAFVLLNYSKFAVTDVQLLTLLHFQLVEGKKSGWEIVAKNLGYSSLAPLKRTLKHLEDKGVKIDGYKVDPSEFYERCLSLEQSPKELITLFDEKAENKREDRTAYQLYPQIKEICPMQNEHTWAKVVKKLLKRGETIEDMVLFVIEMDAHYKQIYKDFPRKVKPFDLQDQYFEWKNNAGGFEELENEYT